MNEIAITKDGSSVYAYGIFNNKPFDVEVIFGTGTFGRGEIQKYLSHLEGELENFTDEEIEQLEIEINNNI